MADTATAKPSGEDQPTNDTTPEFLHATWLAARRHAWRLADEGAAVDVWLQADQAAYEAYRRYAAAVTAA